MVQEGRGLGKKVRQCIGEQVMFERHAINTRGRDLAIGDIHGCFSAVRAALEAIGFDGRCDRLFSVGDLVDRGPESPEVLSWLRHPWFHAVCGNHDFMTWRRARGVPLEDVDHRAHGGAWLDACTPAQRHEVADALSGLPVAMEIETTEGAVGIVHADCPYDDWAPMRAGRYSDADLDCCLWSEARYRARYMSPVRGLRALIHGHMYVRRPLQLGNVFYIDTGGWLSKGHFTLFDLHALRPVVAR